MITLRQRYQGTLVGVHAGDSLGAAYEKWDADKIAKDIDRRGGLVPFDYDDPWGKAGHFPAGRPTDDSELTAALALSIITMGGPEPDYQYTLFKRVVDGASFLWGGVADGFGGTTKKMLVADTYAEAQQQPDKPYIASNGSLMRSAPLALWFYMNDSSDVNAAVRESSRVTHIHERAIECCVIYVNFLKYILGGITPTDAWKLTCERDSMDEDVEKILVPDIPKPDATNVWMGKGGLAGSALHTLHIAVWSTLHATDFRNGIETAIRFAGDTDTAAAVTGSLLGAHYGLEGIPLEWREILKGGEEMIELADDIYDLQGD